MTVKTLSFESFDLNDNEFKDHNEVHQHDNGVGEDTNGVHGHNNKVNGNWCEEQGVLEEQQNAFYENQNKDNEVHYCGIKADNNEVADTESEF